MKIKFPCKLIPFHQWTILVFELKKKIRRCTKPLFSRVSSIFLFFSVYFFKFSLFARVSVTNFNLLLTTMPTCRYGIKSGLRVLPRKENNQRETLKKKIVLQIILVDYANIPPFFPSSYLLLLFFFRYTRNNYTESWVRNRVFERRRKEGGTVDKDGSEEEKVENTMRAIVRNKRRMAP